RNDGRGGAHRAAPGDPRARFASPHLSAAYFLSVSAATPGRVLPSRYSSEAPPPVDTCETLLATPAFLTAEAESPAPMTVVAPWEVALASASAMAMVPLAVASISKTPTGPFQRMVLALSRMLSNC